MDDSKDAIRAAYELLEVPPDAGRQEIRSAYLLMLKVWHPDRFPADPSLQARAVARTAALNAAFAVIRGAPLSQQAPDDGPRPRPKDPATSSGDPSAPTPVHTNQASPSTPVARRRGHLRWVWVWLAVLVGARLVVYVTRPTRQKFELPSSSFAPVVQPIPTSSPYGPPQPLPTQQVQAGFASLLAAAQNGDAVAQNNLAIAYRDGTGVQSNSVEAIRWFREAANQGLAVAQLNLGIAFDRGEGADRDPKEAARWFRKASTQGLAVADYYLGWAYWNGEGVRRSESEARRLFQRAADGGVAAAKGHLAQMRPASKRGNPILPEERYSLGLCHHSGGFCGVIGGEVSRNPKEAVHWWSLAANQGHAAAQASMGWAYYSGTGVEKNLTEALRWYRQAADGGNPGAQRTLGWAYERGIGVEKDLDLAAVWYGRAASQGDGPAAVSLARINAGLPTEP